MLQTIKSAQANQPLSASQRAWLKLFKCLMISILTSVSLVLSQVLLQGNLDYKVLLFACASTIAYSVVTALLKFFTALGDEQLAEEFRKAQEKVANIYEDKFNSVMPHPSEKQDAELNNAYSQLADDLKNSVGTVKKLVE